MVGDQGERDKKSSTEMLDFFGFIQGCNFLLIFKKLFFKEHKTFNLKTNQ